MNFIINQEQLKSIKTNLNYIANLNKPDFICNIEVLFPNEKNDLTVKVYFKNFPEFMVKSKIKEIKQDAINNIIDNFLDYSSFHPDIIEIDGKCEQ